MGVVVAALLLVPLIAMGLTDEVRWTALDFAAAALLLTVAAIGCELALRSLDGGWRVMALGGVLVIVALLWAQGAVGIV